MPSCGLAQAAWQAPEAVSEMLAVTALTRLWPLYWASLIPTVGGLMMGIAGLTSLPIHPEMLVKLLS